MKTCAWKTYLVFLLLTGCHVGNRYKTPEPAVELPQNWHASPCETREQQESLDCFVWWEALNDPTLNSLLRRAAERNLDLSLAMARILEAKAERKGKTSSLYPHIDASLNYGHVYYNKEKLVHALLGHHDKHVGKRNTDFFEIGFDADWEIDVFGANAHELKAAQANVQVSQEAFNDVWVTLSAEVARNYIELRGLQHRLQILEKNIASQFETFFLTEDLADTGMTSDVDLMQSKEQLHSLEAQKPQIQYAIDKTIHRLSILLGYAPGELFEELGEFQSLPQLPCQTPVGIPSDLLRRRPDIRQAERKLAAASERVRSAIASLFPRLSLRGFIGDLTTHLPSLFNMSSALLYGGPQILMPVFNSRLLTQDVEYNKIKTQEAVYDYQKTVLHSLEESENAIAAFQYELNRNNLLKEAYEANLKAYELTRQVYQKGLKSYLDLLVTTRSLLSAEDQYIQSRIDLFSHYIALYKALGGGWDVQFFADECL